MQQTVSVVESPSGDWFVFLTIPLGTTDSITAVVLRTEDGIIAKSEGRRLFRALNANSARTTHFASTSDAQCNYVANTSWGAGLVVDIPTQAMNALATEVLR